MRIFLELSPVLQGLIGLYAVLLLLTSVILIILSLLQHDRKAFILVPVSLFLYMTFQCICTYNLKSATTLKLRTLIDYFSHIPLFCFGLLFLLTTVLECMIYKGNRVWRQTHITRFSIKEAIDNLPVGICCYETNGQILMKNKVMEKLYRDLTGEPLLNAISFMNEVYLKGEQTEKGVIIKLEDETVFTLTDKSFSEEESSLRVLTAADITKQYKNTQILAKQQEIVINLNKELTEYGKQIVSSITAREVLNAKVKLHDEIGTNLLESKRFILNGGTPEKRAAIENALLKNLQYLKQETEHVQRDEYAMILNTAEALDMKITVTGKLTECEPERHIIVTGIHECLTNTIRHAKGDKLMVLLEETDEFFYAIYSNNGEAPVRKVEERGGLALLRALVAENGGTMHIESRPEFVLTLKLPKI